MTTAEKLLAIRQGKTEAPAKEKLNNDLIKKWDAELKHWKLKGAATADPIEKNFCRGICVALSDCILDFLLKIENEKV